MSRAPSTFRQRDLTAALKAARAAGCEVARVEVGKDGRIVVVLANGKEQPDDKNRVCGNEWDSVLK
jgi:hypothetical protein